MSKLFQNILEGQDIRKSIMQEAEADDLMAQGKELTDLLEKVTGLQFDYDFEDGQIVCFCTDNIPANVTVIRNFDFKYELYLGDDLIDTYDSPEEVAQEVKNRTDDL